MFEEILETIEKNINNWARENNVRISQQFIDRIISDVKNKRIEILDHIDEGRMTPDKIYKSTKIVLDESLLVFKNDISEGVKIASERFIKTNHLAEAKANRDCTIFPFCAVLR